MDYAEEMKITAGTVLYSLAIIVWVNNFQTPEIQAVLSNDDNNIAGGSNRGSGWGVEGGLNIGVQNGIYIIDGYDLTIVCRTASGMPPITTTWFHNGALDLLWMNASTITILNVGLNLIGDNYTCRASNDVGYDDHTTTINMFDEQPINSTEDRMTTVFAMPG